MDTTMDEDRKEFSPHNRNNSLSALASTLSASSSLSGVMSKQWIPEESYNEMDEPINSQEPNSHNSSSTATPHHSTSRFKHYYKPTISESPTLVSLCQKYIDEGNIDGLARIARNRGLPPALRQYAWPLLLSSHPYAISPSIVAEYPGSYSGTGQNLASTDDDIVPIKRIRGDISRYRKRLKQQQEAASRQKSASTSRNLSRTSTVATQTPSSTSPPGNNAFSYYDSDAVNAYLNESMENQRYEVLEETIENFLKKWGASIPYESGMVWTAFALADWVDPVYILDLRHPQRKRKQAEVSHQKESITKEVIEENQIEDTTDSSSSDSPSPSPSLSPTPSHSSATSGVHSESSTPELTPVGVWEQELQQHSFSDVFEKFMLVLFHSPPLSSDGPSGPCDSHISQRLSLFLSIFKKLLPELSDYFDEEDVLSSIGGDEWLLWWVKWMGAKVWNKFDRGRAWDMYLGWRPTNPKEATQFDVSQADVGVDPFWSPIELESDSILAPHIQHLFVCFAILKSKSHTLFELDQSEIRQFLTQVSKSNDMESIILEAGEAWRSWQWAEENDESD
ncbi:Oca5p [Sugiyamaella lignohabitans]|uniref:Oca5p n=1 Tax=Sugiyamaella lignohabitans TaxID=796027 RepID=A0A167CIA9_9ASCO|nr:Oca5p [Sugiyamaella lignohabitans]ANB11736.1 Oca5p [Sugiyamaella lignohabitans]